MKKVAKFFLVLFILLIGVSYLSADKAYQHLKFGIMAAQKDLWEEAIFQWKKAIKLNPNNAAAHNNLAVAYEKKGMYQEAKKEYELALKLSPQDSRIKTNYEKFLKIYKSLKSEQNEN
ncbi:MAG: tetratricopeptide repeat protein [Candidatus Aminicenantia bacterium]